MAQYLSSDSVKVEEEKRIILAEFNHGTLTPTGKKKINFTCYKSTKKNTSPFPHRILVAKSTRMCYAGSNFETQMSKITSSVQKLFVVNKKDLTIKMYSADFFPLTPQFKSPDQEKIKENDKSYVEKSCDLAVEFGTKSQQKTINTKRKYGTGAAASDSTDILIKTAEMQNLDLPVEHSVPSAIPPQNSSAINVDEVYNLYDIISLEELNALTSETQVFLDAKHETIELWKTEQKYSPFIIQFIESNKHSMDCDKAKLLCYLHYMFCFLRTVYSDWKKKDPVPNVPEPFKQKLMDSFTIKKSLPQRLKDKLLAYAMVLGLKLCNYVLNCNLFSNSGKIPLTRMTAVAYALGCHISENKNSGMKTIELKLPLYKFQALPRRGRRS